MNHDTVQVIILVLVAISLLLQLFGLSRGFRP